MKKIFMPTCSNRVGVAMTPHIRIGIDNEEKTPSIKVIRNINRISKENQCQ